MLLRPTRVLITAACVVCGSMFAMPFVTGGVPVPEQWALVFLASLRSSILFLIPATAIWLAARKRWPALCSVAIIAWCVCYFGLFGWALLTGDL
jgi:hypothetical protein